MAQDGPRRLDTIDRALIRALLRYVRRLERDVAEGGILVIAMLAMFAWFVGIMVVWVLFYAWLSWLHGAGWKPWR